MNHRLSIFRTSGLSGSVFGWYVVGGPVRPPPFDVGMPMGKCQRKTNKLDATRG